MTPPLRALPRLPIVDDIPRPFPPTLQGPGTPPVSGYLPQLVDMLAAEMGFEYDWVLMPYCFTRSENGTHGTYGHARPTPPRGLS